MPGLQPPSLQLSAGPASPPVQRLPDGAPIQRRAFVNDTQVGSNAPGLNGNMQAMVNDNTIRDYQTMEEFQNHAAGNTDYIGNLADGTWLRFFPTGLNIIGERHTEVTLSAVLNAVGPDKRRG